MCYYKRGLVPIVFLSSLVFFCLPFAASECRRQPVIFNFGDSNSDTGGFAAANGFSFGYPYARAFFHQPTGRLCDGRLIIDFLCEKLKTSYLKPYLDSLILDSSSGVNFAVSGATTLPRNALFNLGVQTNQFALFHNRSINLRSKGDKNLFGNKDFKNALYTLDIGGNDLLVYALNFLPYDQVLKNIPSIISEIRDATRAIYRLGGRKFWVHNTGPLGCLPQQLGIRKPNATEVDEYGCISILNEGAKVFNSKLDDLSQELRLEMKDSTIVYVDVYSIKYNLIVNSSSYGIAKPLMACCGHGGPPYNYDPKIRCLVVPGFNLCKKGTRSVSWDGFIIQNLQMKLLHLKYCPTNIPHLQLDSTSFVTILETYIYMLSGINDE